MNPVRGNFFVQFFIIAEKIHILVPGFKAKEESD